MRKIFKKFLFDKRIRRVLGAAFLLAFTFAGWNTLTTYANEMAIFLNITMQTQESGTGVLYYDVGRRFNEESKSTSFINGDGRFHECNFKIPVLTTIYSLRFDPPSLNTGEVIIKRVELVDHHGWVLHRFSLDRLKAVQHIEGFVKEKGEIRFSIEDGANDPQICIQIDKPMKLDRGLIVWVMLSRILLHGGAIFLCCVVLIFIWSQGSLKKPKTYNILFYSLVAAAILFIFLSNPFLVKEYDPWKWHLSTYIADYYFQGTSPPGGARIWHFCWAWIFKFIGVSDVLIWAKIIHELLFVLAFVVLYYFSRTALTILIRSSSSKLQGIKSSEGFLSSGNDNDDTNKLSTIQIKYLSLFAVFLWFIGNGTFSTSDTLAYQQAWIMWYSVTYQGLTIPLFWYCTALTLIIFYEELSLIKTVLYVIQIAIASFMIATFHAQELVYYIILISVIFLVNIKRIFSVKNKIVLFVAIPVIFFITFIAANYFMIVIHYPPPIFSILSSEPIDQVLQKFNDAGHNVTNYLNRFPNSFSEIAIISLIAMIIFRVNYFFVKDNNIPFNRNFFDVLLASSLVFFMIPMVPFLAGVFSYISHSRTVYRFFFASPWFIFLPFVIYKVINIKEIHISYFKVVITVVLIIFSIFRFHQYFFPYHTILNAKSIIYSLDKTKMGISIDK